MSQKNMMPTKSLEIKKPKKIGKKQCPTCSARNIKSNLKIHQITDTSAVILCSRDKCLFRREVRRDYNTIELQQVKTGDEDHKDKTAALKKWTFDGKKAVDTFKCPLSLKDGSPEEACTVLKQATTLVGIVMGKDMLPSNFTSNCGMDSCGWKRAQYHGEQDDREGLGAVDVLLEDYAQLNAHKEACHPSNFVAEVEHQFSLLEEDLRRLNIDLSMYKRRVANTYSSVDRAALFSKWLGDRFDFVERHEVLCGGVVDLSGDCSPRTREAVPAGETDALDMWLNDAQSSEWDLNDSFTAMFPEADKENTELSTAQTTCL